MLGVVGGLPGFIVAIMFAVDNYLAYRLVRRVSWEEGF